MEVYEPELDSELIKSFIKDYAKGKVLDMGTGSGILANEASKYAKVTAADLNPKSIKFVKKTLSKIKIIETDLFLNIKEKGFDLIIFNPPYLPEDKGHEDIALYGGKHGYETIVRFLKQAPKYLTVEGKILLLYSSLSKEEKVIEEIGRQGLKYKELAQKQVFFEILKVIIIEKAKLRKEIEQNKITELEYFSKGKRGIIFKGKYKKKIVAVKTKNPTSEAIGRIENEARILKKLEPYKIGPKLMLSKKNYIVYEFVKGIPFIDYLKEGSKRDIKEIIINVLSQCFVLDKLKINKQEMHRPYKNLIIGKEPVLIDFERARNIENPSNLTQFLQFVSNHFSLEKEFLKLVKNYKREIITNNTKDLEEKYQIIVSYLKENIKI